MPSSPRQSSCALNKKRHPPPIEKGKACQTCRRRKIRCNGQRPICSQCSGGPYEAECEYADAGPSIAKKLQAKIDYLSRRVEELERVQGQSSDSDSDWSPPPPTRVPEAPFVTDEPLILQGVRTTSPSLLDGQLITPKEPPAFIIRILLHAFFHMSTEAIFFLNFNNFRDSALLPLPLGHPSRPLPALLSVVYLWGLHISGNDFNGLEPALLEQTIQRLQTSHDDHPDLLLHTMQAQLLLAHYLCGDGRVQDGREYLQSAVETCFKYGFHQIPNGDDERARAFWAVFVVNNSWSAGLAFPSMISYNDVTRVVDTPWPTETTGSSTVVKYLQGQCIGQERSVLALHAQASILYERASHLFAQATTVDSNIAHTTTHAFITLNNLILELRAQLATLNQAKQVTEPSPIIVTHALVNAAAIQLHCKFAVVSMQSRHTLLASAKEIIDWASGMEQAFTLHLSNFCAVPWRLACEALVLSNSGDTPLITFEELRHYLQSGMAAMERLCLCPLMLKQYKMVRKELGFADDSI